MSDPSENPLKRFIVEAHRRSLGQVLAVYLVGSWVAYEVILSLTEGLALPDWVPPFALVLFIIGLPMVLATAFVQEGIPQDNRGSDEEERGAPPETAADGAAAGRAEGDASHPLFTWSRSLGMGVAAFFLLALATGTYMGMRTMGIGPVGTLIAQGELEARQPLVVADFEGITGDSLLAVVVTEALRADLAQSPVVTVADRVQVADALERMMRPPDARLEPATAREVALRLGLKGVVEGAVGRAGAGYILNARVVTADSGRTLATFRETAEDSARIVHAIERLSHGLREKVGESLRTVRASQPLAEVTTPSLPALRKWSEAMAIERRGGDRNRAIRLLEEAVARDSAFAVAWRDLGVLHYNAQRPVGTLRSLERALDHEERLPEAGRRELRAFHAAITGDLRDAIDEYEELLALGEDTLGALTALSDLTWNSGDFEAAAGYARRLLDASEEPNWVAYWNLYVAQMDGGRVEAARRTAEESGSPFLLRFQYFNEGEYAAADTLFPGDHPWQAWSALLRGRMDEAVRRRRESTDESDARRWGDLARVLVVGDAEAADRLAVGLGMGLTDGLSQRVTAELAVLLAMAGRPEAAARARALYEERVPPELRWNEADRLHMVEAFRALREDRRDEAFARFAEARESTPWTAPVDGLLGRAFEMADRADSAVAAYARYLETPWAYRGGLNSFFFDATLLVPTHERLALLHHRLGNRQSAARHAGRVVELWADADPELQPRVEAMRRIAEAGEGR